MIRVLHLMRSLNAGGIGTYIMNNYRSINRDKIQFDFAITHGGMGEYGAEIEEKGGHIYFISTEGNRNFLDGAKQLVNLYKLCKKNNYNAIHCHYYFANAYFLSVAKWAGIKKRISHCHNTRTKEIGVLKQIFEFISRKILLKVGTDFLGCSDAATVFLYGEKALNNGIAKTLYNGIDYSYWDKLNIDIKSTKEKYHINNEKVLLFVGRLEEQKNPIFALEVVWLIQKKMGNIKLFVVGEGSYHERVKKYVDANDMNEYVTLLPANSNIRELQAISDIMIAPSLWEGLSIAYLEAQKMETMIFASDQVPKEVDMGYCQFLPLNNTVWVSCIIDYLTTDKITNIFMRPERFDINQTVKELLNVYTK